MVFTVPRLGQVEFRSILLLPRAKIDSILRVTALAESSLHRRMKSDVTSQLEMEGYSVIREPLAPPAGFLEWERYRPDLLGIKMRDGALAYAFVECETHPSTRRLNSKNYHSVVAQGVLDCSLSLRRIVVVPHGTLRRLDPKVRIHWEVWVYGEGDFDKIRAVPGAAGQSGRLP